jgi:hypothetical protein
MLLLIAFPVLLETSVCFFACYREIGSDMIRWQLVGAGAPGSGVLAPGSLVFFSSVLLWRGAMSNAVDLNLNLVRSEKIQKLLKNYPPKKR